MMTATLFIPYQAPKPTPSQGLRCEPNSVAVGAMCVAAGLLGVEMLDVHAFCVNFATGVMAYVGGELHESAAVRNRGAEEALNRQLPGLPFFGNARKPATCVYGTLLLVERCG